MKLEEQKLSNSFEQLTTNAKFQISFVECSAEVASLQQQIQCLQQELATKRAHVDSLSTQMASLVGHQKGVKQLNGNIESQIQSFKDALTEFKRMS